MKMKEEYLKEFKPLLSNNFEEGKNIMKIKVDGPDEFNVKHFVAEGQYNNKEFVIIFQIPGPESDETYMKDLCLKYGHGITRFLQDIDDFLIKEKTEAFTPLYNQQEPVDFFVEENLQKGGEWLHLFSTKYDGPASKWQVGFIASESTELTKMLIKMFSSYFGDNVDFRGN